MTNRRSLVAVLGPALVFLATVGIRLVPWNCTLTGWDEWILATIATRIARWWIPQRALYDLLVPTGYSYPPLQLWISGLLVYCFGTAPLVWRMPTILSDAGAACVVFMLGRRLGGPMVGWTAGLLAWSNLYLRFHDTVSLDFLMSFWILLSLISRKRKQTSNGFRLS